MTLRDLVDKLLGRQPASASTARDRLQLVLEEGDVSLETEDRVTALVANLPFRRPVASTNPKSD